ncbi:Phytochrome, two-component sensor histidine kinase [Anaerovibrio sp. JC8]|uniref:response regulator n=1 Tax=Anaerovibrio sp. JC8 TaxID=1240085 RepID=UPI000A0974D1|nr:transporter substrate-binding domain-containing protein [Anaerovibrio sp. JC8]ORU00064.1 Phytochrome, two-component sensor histidine kinase [Anaerovibrio sp. JC8]
MRCIHREILEYLNIKMLFCLTFLLACFVAGSRIMSVLPAEANNEKVIRVGYYEETGFQMGSGDNVVKSGYAYDYLQRLKLLNSWKYEYVYGTYGELYDKLLKGEIDFLAGLAHTPDREAVINFPDAPMGYIQYLFFKRSSDDSVTSDPNSFTGKKIAALTGAQYNLAVKFLKDHNINADIIQYTDIKERDDALKKGLVDIMIAEGYNSFKNMGIENCLEAGYSDYYLAVNKARPDILAEVDKSQHRLYRESPDFIADLTNKWFKRTSFTTTLSKVEQKWLAEHDSITVGYLNDYLPYCTTDSDGNVTGVVKDIVPEIFNSLGFSKIKISYKGYDNVTDLNKALHDHDVDVIFPVVSNYWISEVHDIVPSVPAVSSYFNVLYAGEYPNLAKSKIAVSERNGIMDDYRSVYYPNSEFTYYKNAYDCLDAVLKGEADAVFVSDLRTEYLLRSRERYKDLNTAQLLHEGTLGFAGLRSNNEGMQVLNHGLSLIDKDFALSHAYNYMPKNEISVADFFRKHIWIPIAIVSLFFLTVIFFMSRESKKKSAYLRTTEEQRQKLADQVEEISVLNEELTAMNEELQAREALLEELSEEKDFQLAKTKILNKQLQDQQAELQEARDAANKANDAKTAFLFNMSHDIRTPLNAIIGFTELEERSSESTIKNKQYRKKIKMASHQLLDILNNVLEMSRIESKKLVIEEGLTDAVELFESCLAIFEGEMKNKDQHFTSSCDIKHKYLYIDRTHVAEVIMNIFSNSVKYTPEGGDIFAGVRELPGKNDGECIMEFTVRDNGIGMSEEFVSQIFEQFSRARTTSQSGIQGTGLGMAIVKSMIDIMGGTIEVKSKLGEGTEMTFRLPHRIGEAPQEADGSNVHPEVLDFSGKRILMAEDNELNAEIAMTLLEDSGFAVERAKDGLECIEMLKEHDANYYDIILMDVQMPNLNGYDTTQQIRKMEDPVKANIPIVAMTANAFKEDQQRALDIGMNGHLAKPIDISKVFGTLKEILLDKDEK